MQRDKKKGGYCGLVILGGRNKIQYKESYSGGGSQKGAVRDSKEKKKTGRTQVSSKEFHGKGTRG